MISKDQGSSYVCYAVLSCSGMYNSLQPLGLWGFSGQEYWSGLPCLPWGIFLTQGSNPGFPRYRRILYQLSHQGSPRILEWVAYPFSRGSSQPRNQTGVSCIVGGFFTSWATRETQLLHCESVFFNPVFLSALTFLFFTRWTFCMGSDY